MRTYLIFILVSLNLNAQDSTSQKQLQSKNQIHYSIGFFPRSGFSDYHAVDYSWIIEIRSHHHFLIRAELLYHSIAKKNIGNENWDITDPHYFTTPLYLGYQYRFGKKRNHNFDIEFGSKIWSKEPSKRYSKGSFWRNYSQGEYRSNLMLLANVGYSYTVWKDLFVDFHINTMITQVLQNADPTRKSLGVVPSMRFGLGYRF